MTAGPGRPKGPGLTPERARVIRAAAAKVKRADRALAQARLDLAAELRAGREEGAALRDLGAEAGLVVSRVHKLVSEGSA